MSGFEYPETVAGPYDPPPYVFEDREGREIRVERYDADTQLEAVVEMYEAFDPADRAQGIPPVKSEAIRTWLESILDEECVNVLAWDGDEVVGHATLVPDGESAYELAIFVLSEYQDAGIGTGLIEALLGAGRESGIDRVWLTVERWNNPAVALYRKVGFEAGDAGSFELEMTAALTEAATGSGSGSSDSRGE
jgi:ribosomal protein S18 acetylase RimI-like enzyme